MKFNILKKLIIVSLNLGIVTSIFADASDKQYPYCIYNSSANSKSYFAYFSPLQSTIPTAPGKENCQNVINLQTSDAPYMMKIVEYPSNITICTIQFSMVSHKGDLAFQVLSTSDPHRCPAQGTFIPTNLEGCSQLNGSKEYKGASCLQMQVLS